MTDPDRSQDNEAPSRLFTVAEVLAWYHSELRDVRREQERVQNIRELASRTGQDISLSVEFARGALSGRQRQLQGFAAFLLSHQGLANIELIDTEPEPGI